MLFQRENQRLSASDILQAIAAGNQIKLLKCTIAGELNINRLLEENENFDVSGINVESSDDKITIVLREQMEFNDCIFEDNVYFAPPWDKPSHVEVVFEKDAVFNSSHFKGQTRFAKAKFLGYAGFDGCTFERIAVFRDVIFQGRVMFRTVVFTGYGLFNGTVFKKDASFTNTCFAKGGNFTDVKFFDRTDFSGVYAMSKSVPVYEDVWFARQRYGEDETFWRFVKQAAQEAGHYQLAGESFFSERCAHLCYRFFGHDFDELSLPGKLLKLAKGIKLLPEMIFGRLLFGYGERPVRVLFASLIIIVVCGIYYASPSAMIYSRLDSQISRLGFMDGLYFSTITFTTLGFGDVHPAPVHLPTKCVAMIEALSGACLMALFVVGLSKRYSRG
jgi:hypothetical protein